VKYNQAVGMEFRWKMRSMLEMAKSLKLNMSKKEVKGLRPLKLNKDTSL
jgi:hypothetical protein